MEKMQKGINMFKKLLCLYLVIFGYNMMVAYAQSESEAPLPPVTPLKGYDNQILLRGSELCPQSLMAINTQLSPSGDVLVWCAEPPSSKSSAKKSEKKTQQLD